MSTESKTPDESGVQKVTAGDGTVLLDPTKTGEGATDAEIEKILNDGPAPRRIKIPPPEEEASKE